jgi:hypothetical protein
MYRTGRRSVRERIIAAELMKLERQQANGGQATGDLTPDRPDRVSRAATPRSIRSEAMATGRNEEPSAREPSSR